jgi:hypothetical protein
MAPRSRARRWNTSPERELGRQGIPVAERGRPNALRFRRRRRIGEAGGGAEKGSVGAWWVIAGVVVAVLVIYR